MSRWYAKVGDDNYSIELAAAGIRFTKDAGTPESFGGNEMPYPRFLRSEKWQRHIAQVFGAQVLEAVLAAAHARTK